MFFDGTSIPRFSRLLNRSLASVQHAFQNKEDDLFRFLATKKIHKDQKSWFQGTKSIPSAYEVTRSSLLLRGLEQEEPRI